jgi:tRNA modification GTPase
MEVQAICAIATPPGSSALGIIRISGKNLKELTKKIFSKELENRKAVLVDIRDNKRLLDNCISIYYEAPKSYTGEDMIEIICHGNHGDYEFCNNSS